MRRPRHPPKAEPHRGKRNHDSCATSRSDDKSNRELIDTGTDKRYVRRDEKGQFKESVDVGRSLAADRRQHAKHESKPGEGDRGDRKS